MTRGPEPATDSYLELRRIAHSLMEHERLDHTLEPTALVHEAWLRLRNRPDLSTLPADELLSLAAVVMRHVLTDHARRRSAHKRGGDRAIAGSDPGARAENDFVVDLDRGLNALEEHDPELARLVELKFYAGRTTEQIAEVLGLSPRTVKRRWRFARAWLQRRMTEDGL